MKKIVSLLILLTLAVSAFVACGAPAEKEYSLSIGVVVTPSLDKAKVTETVAAIVTDTDGKIVLCRLDCLDYTAKFVDGALDTTAPASKAAQGEAYDAYSPMPAGTWFKQADALSAYVVGKTQAEVATVADAAGYVSDAELKASCSINVADMVKAIDNAFKSEHKTSFKTSATAMTAGVAVLASVSDTTADDVKSAKLAADFAASVLVDGAVVASILDAAEVELKSITDEGAAEAAFKGTKREQGTAYDAYAPMAAGTWYVQADAFALSAVGKTASDIATLASEGVAGCTIYAGGLKQIVEAAVKAAK